MIAKARLYINQLIEQPLFEKIAHATTAKRAWDMLTNIYKGTVKKVRLQTFRRKFELLQSEILSDSFSRTLALVNQMKANGEDVTDLQVMEKILRTLTAQYEYKVTAIEK